MSGPWSVVVRLAELNRGSVERRLDAEAPTRERIAKLLELVALDRLDATVSLTPWLDGAVIRGRWSGRVVQTCSVSAEDFASELEGDFEVRCVPPTSPMATGGEAAGEIVVDPDTEDPPDVLEDDAVDVAGYVVEHLALELDPFPRAPGVEFEPPPAEPEPTPFAKLAALKSGDGG